MSSDKFEQARYYDERFAGFRHANLLQLERAARILDAILATGLRNPRMVDLGCGPGWLTNVLASFGPAVGVDLSPQSIDEARQRYPMAQYETADIFSWKYEGPPFDIVVSQEVLEHVLDQPRYLDIAFGLLRPSGYLILTTPNAHTMRAMTEKQQKEWTDQPIENWVTGAELRALLARRFTVLSMTSITPDIGSLGSYRLVNSPRIKSLASAAGLGEAFTRMRNRLGYGLHLVAVAL